LLIVRFNSSSSSRYGYLLCLVHFLQTRSPPVVPNLQTLPPDWNGDPRGVNMMHLPPPQSMSPAAAATVNACVVPHPVDKRPVDTYFYHPPRDDFSKVIKAPTLPS
jgi:hypothetical protein